MTIGQFNRYYLIEIAFAIPFFILWGFTGNLIFFFVGLVIMPAGAIIMIRYISRGGLNNHDVDE